MKLPANFRYSTGAEDEEIADALNECLNAALIELYSRQVGVSPVSLLSMLVRFAAQFTLQAPEEMRGPLMTASVTTYFRLCGGAVYESGEAEDVPEVKH